MKQGTWSWGGKDGEGGEGRGKELGIPGQGIRIAIAGPLTVDDLVSVGRHGRSPPCMSSGCSLSMGEVLQIFMIRVRITTVFLTYDTK